jgi:hypothetical protein
MNTLKKKIMVALKNIKDKDMPYLENMVLSNIPQLF